MAQNSQVRVDLGRSDGHVDEVAHAVVGRDVFRPYGRIVSGSAPILSSPELKVAILVALFDGEGDGYENVSGDAPAGCPCPVCD